jgi:lysophospholipase L1-like esterase
LAESRAERWVGTWATGLVPLEQTVGFAGRTVRMFARISIGGRRFRVRLSNAYGTDKLVVGAARIALRSDGAAIAPESDRRLTFKGSTSTVIPIGALVVSDSVELDVPALADVAVSLYVPSTIHQPTGHGNGHQTNYLSPPGDFTGTHPIPDAERTEDYLFLSGIETLALADAGCVVAFGDSLTEGNISTLDANTRWPNELARRLAARSASRPMAVINQGIGGNRILHDVRGESGLRRFDRDVLAQTGATHVIVLLGINDIRNRTGKAEEAVSANEMIVGLQQLAVRAQARGLKIFGGTLLTFEHETFNPGFYTEEGEAKRQAVNEWVRRAGAFDAVIDFEKALRDPDHPTRMLPVYDCGDHLHPSDAGYVHMGEVIDLSLFD